jgi:hypothetical protein
VTFSQRRCQDLRRSRPGRRQNLVHDAVTNGSNANCHVNNPYPVSERQRPSYGKITALLLARLI